MQVVDGTLANGCDDWNAASFPECVAICSYATINATCLELWTDPQCNDGIDGTEVQGCVQTTSHRDLPET